MQPNKRTPSQGLKILENLYEKFPKNQQIRNSLINAYIRFNIHAKAIALIDTIPIQRTNTHTLQLNSWVANQKNDLITQKNNWERILSQDYLASVHASNIHLIQLSERSIKIHSHEIILFTQVYNEMLRLPNLLKYYRNLGVSQFFIIDNNSTDNCQEFLLSQPDVHLFWTNESHTQSGEGMVWYQYLIDKYLCGNWIIVVDADEFLVYPNCENKKLPQLISFLDKYGYEAMASFMLDMFPKNLEQQLQFSSDRPLLEQSPYFYNYYKFIGHINPPYFDVNGGIFYYLEKFLPPLIKTPLIKSSTNIRYIQTHHRITPAKMASITSAFLHFKFIGDFYRKSKNAVKEKRYWAGGRAYRTYFQMYDTRINKTFDFTQLDKTTKYQNSQQLVELGLIKTSEEWEKFCQNSS